MNNIRESNPVDFHRFTTEDLQRMAQIGVLGGDARVELIDGRLIDMAPIGPLHADIVDVLTRTFYACAPQTLTARIQGPLQLDPQTQVCPDLTVVPTRRYDRAHPSARDALWVIEVADSTLERDVGVKVPLYARFRIPHVWVIDIPHRRVMTYCDPSIENRSYAVTRTVSDGALPMPQGIGAEIDVRALFAD